MAFTAALLTIGISSAHNPTKVFTNSSFFSYNYIKVMQMNRNKQYSFNSKPSNCMSCIQQVLSVLHFPS